MSTTYGSEQGTVFILDDPTRRCERRSAAPSPTPAREVRRGPDKAGITNLIEILSVIRGVDARGDRARVRGLAATATSRARSPRRSSSYLAPVRERYAELRADEAAIEAILAAGAEKARAIAAATLADVRDAMGVGPPCLKRVRPHLLGSRS